MALTDIPKTVGVRGRFQGSSVEAARGLTTAQDEAEAMRHVSVVGRQRLFTDEDFSDVGGASFRTGAATGSIPETFQLLSRPSTSIPPSLAEACSTDGATAFLPERSLSRKVSGAHSEDGREEGKRRKVLTARKTDGLSRTETVLAEFAAQL